MQCLQGSEALDSLGTGVRDTCKLLGVDAGTQITIELGSSGRAVHTLNC